MPLLLAIAACSPFGSATTAPEDTTVTGDGRADAAPTDGSADAATDGGADADSNAADCNSDIVLVGTNEIAKNYDRVPTTAVDAYGFVAPPSIATVTARCAKLYVGNREELGDGTIVFGVYADGGLRPGTRIAAASFVDVKVGWNVALLDPPVTVTPGKTFWLAFTPTKGAFSVVINGVCGLNQNARRSRDNLVPGDLPNPFDANGVGTECGASAFLAP